MSFSALVASVKALGTFIFGSKESKAEQRVIMRRFKTWLCRMFGANGAADEIEDNAKDERELAKLKTLAEKKKAEVLAAQQEVKLQAALDILEKRQAEKEKKHAAVIDNQHEKLKRLPPGKREAAAKKLDADRDHNAADAADIVCERQLAIENAGGSITIDPESLAGMDAFINDEPVEPADAGDSPDISEPAAADAKPKPKRKTAKSAKKPSEVIVPKPKAAGSPSIKPKSGKKPKGS